MHIIGFIVVGDRTSHGGHVLENDARRTIDGLRVARLGDSVWCPRCKRSTTIATSRFPHITENGMPLAFDGDVTDCGAQLYSRHNGHAGHGGDAAPAVHAAPVLPVSPVQPGSSLGVQEHFVLRDQGTHEGLAGLHYTITSSDGRVVAGQTDTLGRTGIVWTGAPVDLNVVVHPPQGDSDDPYHFSEAPPGGV